MKPTWYEFKFDNILTASTCFDESGGDVAEGASQLLFGVIGKHVVRCLPSMAGHWNVSPPTRRQDVGLFVEVGPVGRDNSVLSSWFSRSVVTCHPPAFPLLGTVVPPKSRMDYSASEYAGTWRCDSSRHFGRRVCRVRTRFCAGLSGPGLHDFARPRSTSSDRARFGGSVGVVLIEAPARGGRRSRRSTPIWVPWWLTSFSFDAR